MFVEEEANSGSGDPGVKKSMKIVWQTDHSACVGASAAVKEAVEEMRLMSGLPVSGDCLQCCNIYTDDHKLIKGPCQALFPCTLASCDRAEAVALLFLFLDESCSDVT